MKNKIVKLEIIIPTLYLSRLINFLNTYQVSGYTVIEIDQGKGINHGEYKANDLLPTTRSHWVFCIILLKQFTRIKNELEDFLSELGGAYILIEVLNATNIKVKKDE